MNCIASETSVAIDIEEGCVHPASPPPPCRWKLIVGSCIAARPCVTDDLTAHSPHDIATYHVRDPPCSRHVVSLHTSAIIRPILLSTFKLIRSVLPPVH